jgi:adenylate kinase
MNNPIQKPIFVFIGIPGSGKDTQAEFLAQELHLPHIDIGNTLTNIIKNKGQHWEKIADTYKHGPVSSEIVMEIMENRFIKEDCKNGFILSQHTKSIVELEMMLELYERLGFDICKVFYLDVSVQTAIDRCVSRLNGVFNVKEPDLESIEIRIQNYYKIIQDIILFYKEKNLLVRVDGEKSTTEIFNYILEVVEQSSTVLS